MGSKKLYRLVIEIEFTVNYPEHEIETDMKLPGTRDARTLNKIGNRAKLII
jgi:hypothetical protein